MRTGTVSLYLALRTPLLPFCPNLQLACLIVVLWCRANAVCTAYVQAGDNDRIGVGLHRVDMVLLWPFVVDGGCACVCLCRAGRAIFETEAAIAVKREGGGANSSIQTSQRKIGGRKGEGKIKKARSKKAESGKVMRVLL
uniref:Uncharacterized protein n=1 Tax=Palpitomonas bilix TaxID=652834 RepID=A0A7S3GEE1_9EUKA|mmetsp:Transcript_45952/g.118636  ORF Transcript_45952/g.118636 Transcript_45952/m.118636 type:complete len:140 (+) Transcript_45952:114-533(+)